MQKTAEASAKASSLPPSGPAAYIVNVDNRDYRVIVREEGSVLVTAAQAAESPATAPVAVPEGGVVVEAPVSGVVLKFVKGNGDPVAKDETVLVMESMKMELEIKSKAAGSITFVTAVGANVAAGQILAKVQ